LTADDSIVGRIASGFAVALLLLVTSPSLLPVGVLAGIGAFLAPDLVLARAARARARRADAELPLFLDLLAAASSAGLAAPAGIRRAHGGLRGPLADGRTGAAAAAGGGGRWRDAPAADAPRLGPPHPDAPVTAA